MITEMIYTLWDAPWIQQMTVYRQELPSYKAILIYIHGGGMLYGDREDLPLLHRTRLTQAGYILAAIDYPLAPAAKLPVILGAIRQTIEVLCSQPENFHLPRLPYVLWGRSSGAYLALLTAAGKGGTLTVPPAAILSYYGYGALTDGWMDSPASFYRKLPAVPASLLTTLPEAIHTRGPMDTHYSAYVHARQTGSWRDLFYDGDLHDFKANATLQDIASLPCPLFCTHAMEDPDVPFAEFQALIEHFPADKYVAAGQVHDFDRKESSYITKKLLDRTIRFLDQSI